MTARFPAERLMVATLAERPELRPQLFSAEFAAAVPEFLRHDPTAALYYERANLDRYLDFVLAAVDREQPDRDALPEDGWDGVIRWAHADWRAERSPNAVSALEIMVLPPYRARGVSQL